MAVERSQLRPQPAQVEDAIDPAQQMIARNPLLKVELVSVVRLNGPVELVI